MKNKKEFGVLKLNKSSIIELDDNVMSTVAGGSEAILSIGATCSCNNSCSRSNVNPACCCYNVAAQ